MLTRETELTIFQATHGDISSVSFVWICRSDDGDIESTLDKYLITIRDEPLPSNLVVINNGLGDRVANRISTRLRETKVPATLINFSLPAAESAALTAAFRHAVGDVIVLLPSYPQSDPKDIARMLDAIRDGLDYVASWRSPRVDSTQEQARSRIFNAITRWCSGISLHDINSGLRVMRREVVQDLPLYGDLHIFLPVLASRQGFQVGEVPVRHLEERPVPGQNRWIYLRRTLDLLSLFFLMRFTQKPFRFFGSIGTGLLVGGGAINLMLAVQKVFWNQDLADRPLLVLATLLMVLGIQMFSLGLIGELIIFVSAGGVFDYRVEQVYELDPTEEDPSKAKTV